MVVGLIEIDLKYILVFMVETTWSKLFALLTKCPFLVQDQVTLRLTEHVNQATTEEETEREAGRQRTGSGG